MKNTLKIAAVKGLRTFLKAGYMMPVARRKVLFSAYEGMQYGCNPKYIFESLVEEIPDVDFVWVLNDPAKLPAQYRGKVRTVKFLSPAHIKELLTASVIVSNLGIEPFLPKRSNQLFINTWHGGGAYKQVSSDLGMFSASQKRYVSTMRDLRSRSTDLFLSSCQRFSEVSARDFGVEAYKFIATGLPRNDRLVRFSEQKSRPLRERICKSNGIDPERLLVLYAPTFRGTFRRQRELDMQVCCREVAETFNRRFGRDVTFLFRSHVAKDEGKKITSPDDVEIVDFTSYPDMQELLEIADVLITDYSSSIWDFSLTGKPGFLFMPDLQEYLSTRGFYTPLEQWPYKYAETVKDFCGIIENHDSMRSAEKIKAHLDLLGSYESGDAVEKVKVEIKKHLG